MIKTIRPRLPRLGKIRLGQRVTNANGKEVPVGSPYFIFPKEGEPGHDLIAGRFDDRTDIIDIHFPVEDIDLVLDEAYRYYTAAGLRCRGDGLVGQYFANEERTDAKGGSYTARELRERHCAAKGCPKAANGDCKPSAYLNFSLSGVIGLGIWQLSTRSMTAIRSWRTTLELARDTFGSIRGVPFQLVRAPVGGQRGDRALTVLLRLQPEFLLQPATGMKPSERNTWSS